MKLLTMAILLFVLFWQGPNIVFSDTMLDESNEMSSTKILAKDDPKMKQSDIISDISISIYSEKRGLCECGVFHTTTPTDKDIPIITKSTFDVECSIYGEDDCTISICPMLDIVNEDCAQELICSTVGDFNHLKTSIHSRICNSPTWTYTGFQSPYEICCHKNEVVECKDDENNPD